MKSLLFGIVLFIVILVIAVRAYAKVAPDSYERSKRKVLAAVAEARLRAAALYGELMSKFRK